MAAAPPTDFEIEARKKYDSHDAAAIRRAAGGKSTSPPAAPKPDDAARSSVPVEWSSRMAVQKSGESTSSSAPSSSSATSSSHSRLDISSQEVEMALRGLDQAEVLRDEGQLEEALKLYMLSIEVLLAFLKPRHQGKQRADVSGLNREVIEERLKVAFTEAETLKGQIDNAKKSRTTASKAPAAKKSGTQSEGMAGLKSLTFGLTSALSRKGWNYFGDGKENESSTTATSTRGRRPSSRSSSPEEGQPYKRYASATVSWEAKTRARKTPSPTMSGRKTPTAPVAARPVPPVAARPTQGHGRPVNPSRQRETQGQRDPQAPALTRKLSRRGSSFALDDDGRRGPVPEETPARQTHQTNSRGGNTANSGRGYMRSQSPAPGARRKATVDYEKDPLVQAVKSDLYIDKSSIRTSWEDIAGLQNAKQALQEAAILPLLRPDLYTGLRKPPKGILLYGPPGTGKTMLVKAVAHESNCILFGCTSSALTSKWFGEGEKLLRTLFRVATDVAPSILFFDEVDALLSSRNKGGGNGDGGGSEHEASRRFKTEFMVQVDGIVAGGDNDNDHDEEEETDGQKNVLVIGCTNCPWDVDDAVMRRFDRRIYVPLPDAEARRALLEHLLRKAGAKNHDITPRQLNQLVQITEGYSCSDITSIGAEAAFGPLRALGDMSVLRDVRTQDVRPMNLQDFLDAIAKTGRSVSDNLLQRYAKWEQDQAARR